MKYEIDREYLTRTLKTVIDVPSPVGYYRELNPVLEELASSLGYTVTYDNRLTAYIVVEGESDRTVEIGAHADTLGLMIRRIDGAGRIFTAPLGGVNYHSLDGEYMTVHTRDGKAYTGVMMSVSHSVHAFTDARTRARDEDNMMILLDKRVTSAADVRALGIEVGDYVSIDPHFTYTEDGFIKSRFIDDKGAVGAVFAALKYLSDNKLKPKHRTIFAFPYYEEKGLGGTYIPKGVSEHIAIDIGLISPDNTGDEYSVSICQKDGAMPYHYDLTSRLIECAKSAGCSYHVDTYRNYSTDAAASLRGGNDLACAVFGMAVYGSHGIERTHIDGLVNTTGLLLEYLLK